MSNAFSSSNYPTKEPDSLVIGDRWAWKRSDLGTDYAPSTYDLTYSLRRETAGSTEIEITASESGTDYLVEVGATTTAAYAPGRYHWQAYITETADTTKRVTVGTGTVDLTENRATSRADPRSHARKVLDSIEAVIEGRATKDQAAYSIEGRQLSRTPIDELLRFRQVYRAEVKQEEVAARIKAGKAVSNRLLVRFA